MSKKLLVALLASAFAATAFAQAPATPPAKSTEVAKPAEKNAAPAEKAEKKVKKAKRKAKKAASK
jgi:Ni/Co efflux regulator RcnB